MKQFVNSLLCLVLIIISQACGINELSKQRVKSLDSLQGAVNTAIQNLQKTDSVSLNALITKYQSYADFINSKINDTLSKSEALNLHGFFESGNFLQAYRINKQTLLQRLNLSNAQLANLGKDIQSHGYNDQLSDQYFKNEWNQTAALMSAFTTQQNAYFENYQKLSQVLPTITEIIKQHNHQHLPIVVESKIP